MTQEQKTLQSIYFDWVNNFLTVERFAEVYGINTFQASALIKIARTAHLTILEETT